MFLHTVFAGSSLDGEIEATEVETARKHLRSILRGT